MKELEKLRIYVKNHMENDSAHDFEHIMRVYKNAEKLSKKEKANKKIILAAALLHDLVNYPKNDKHSKTSSIRSAKKARKILQNYDFSSHEIKVIYDAIRDHSFSRNKIPTSLEGKILQDADRLDALGAIGIARVFAVSGAEKRPFYSNNDPFCLKRKPDDTKWTMDHFFKKLLCLEKIMNTKSAKIEAKKRTRILVKYLSDLKKEI